MFEILNASNEVVGLATNQTEAFHVVDHHMRTDKANGPFWTRPARELVGA